MFNGREKFWASIVGGIAVLWIIGAAVFAVLRPVPVTTPTDADYQAAANVMYRFDARLVPGVATADFYVTQLRLVAPKCTESLMQVVDLFEEATIQEDNVRKVDNVVSIDVLTAYSAATSKRVGSSPCAADVELGELPSR